MAENLHKVVLNSPIERKFERVVDNAEVDLLELTVKIFKILHKNVRLLVVGVCLGLLSGLAYYFLVDPLYQSEMVISVPALKVHELQRLVTDFQERMKVQEQNGSSMFEKVELLPNELEDNHSFVITATSSSVNQFPAIQSAILAHFNTNTFLNEEYNIRREKFQRTMTSLNDEASKVSDMLDRTLTSKSSDRNGIGVADLIKLKLDIQKESIAIAGELQSLRSIRVIQNFFIPSKPYNKNLIKALAIPFVLGILLALVIIATREILHSARSVSDPKTVSFFN